MDLDQYLIHQLNNKFINQPVLINKLIITTLNDHHPQEFFSGEFHNGGVKECYVLTPCHLLYGLVFRPIRQAKNGFWKQLGSPDGKICTMDGVVGIKKKLCFFEGEFGKGSKTNWNMYEYGILQHCCKTDCDHRRERPYDWVLCKVYEALDPDEVSLQLDKMNIG